MVSNGADAPALQSALSGLHEVSNLYGQGGLIRLLHGTLIGVVERRESEAAKYFGVNPPLELMEPAAAPAVEQTFQRAAHVADYSLGCVMNEAVRGETYRDKTGYIDRMLRDAIWLTRMTCKPRSTSQTSRDYRDADWLRFVIVECASVGKLDP